MSVCIRRLRRSWAPLHLSLFFLLSVSLLSLSVSLFLSISFFLSLSLSLFLSLSLSLFFSLSITLCGSGVVVLSWDRSDSRIAKGQDKSLWHPHASQPKQFGRVHAFIMTTFWDVSVSFGLQWGFFRLFRHTRFFSVAEVCAPSSVIGQQ